MNTARVLTVLVVVASACQPPEEDVAGLLPLSSLPPALSETGLDHPDVHEFAPRFSLWSDGLAKRRWIYLPPGAEIDVSDPDDWVFPAGTRLWKELAADGVRLETRMLIKTGASPGDWRMAAYAWDEHQTEAWLAEDGAEDVLGSGHDVPGAFECLACHGSARDRVLGVSAIQAEDGPALPGDATARAALGYLHANCGSCHRADSVLRIELDLSLSVGALERVETTGAYQTAVGVMPSAADGGEALIAPGRPERSSVYLRMAARETLIAMPPLGTQRPDAAGMDAVAAWISSL